MNERLLQYIWQFQYFNKQQISISTGDELIIIHPGTWNHHQGPDFTAARIRIGQTMWAGNIELHVRASDWYKHRHATDENYSNIILHVVWIDDIPVKDQYHQLIPTFVLENRVSKLLLQRYELMMDNLEAVPCHRFLPVVNELTWCAWKERLMIERLERKSKSILHQLHETGQHWDEVFWRQLAIGFGSKVNAAFFEQLSRSIPFAIVLRHRNRLDELEALLFGQVQLLNKKWKDAYPRQLIKIYQHLQKKYQLRKLDGQPAFLRMRPASFPTIRLAQLAMLLHQREHLFDQLRNASSLDDAIKLFHVKASNYWNDHYCFDEPVTTMLKYVGKQMTTHLLINTVIPILFTYGLEKGQDHYKDKSIQWLYGLEPEQNKITRYWLSAGIHNRSALDSQSLIELNTQYCVNKRCLECTIGNKLIRN